MEMEPTSKKTKASQYVYYHKKRLHHYLHGKMARAVLKSVINFAPWKSYFIVALITYVICIICRFVITTVCGVVGQVAYDILIVARWLDSRRHGLESILGNIKQIGCRITHNNHCLLEMREHGFSIGHDWNLEGLQTIANLKDGNECSDFDNSIKVLMYMFTYLVSNDNMQWFKSITLTKIFIYWPLSPFISQAHHSFASDICAFKGTGHIFNFLIADGIVIFCLVLNCMPIIGTLCYILREKTKIIFGLICIKVLSLFDLNVK